MFSSFIVIADTGKTDLLVNTSEKGPSFMINEPVTDLNSCVSEVFNILCADERVSLETSLKFVKWIRFIWEIVVSIEDWLNEASKGSTWSFVSCFVSPEICVALCTKSAPIETIEKDLSLVSSSDVECLLYSVLTLLGASELWCLHVNTEQSIGSCCSGGVLITSDSDMPGEFSSGDRGVGPSKMLSGRSISVPDICVWYVTDELPNDRFTESFIIILDSST